jgi:putative hydrolase of the HAD superfamily
VYSNPPGAPTGQARSEDLLQGCARLRLAPAEIAYVGDRLNTDAMAATNAGLHGIWLNRHAKPAPQGPGMVQTLQGLPTVLTEVAE